MVVGNFLCIQMHTAAIKCIYRSDDRINGCRLLWWKTFTTEDKIKKSTYRRDEKKKRSIKIRAFVNSLGISMLNRMKEQTLFTCLVTVCFLVTARIVLYTYIDAIKGVHEWIKVSVAYMTYRPHTAWNIYTHAVTI